jgi:hypothetical protein
MGRWSPGAKGTDMTKIRCGNHGNPAFDALVYHGSLDEVRACFAGAVGGERTYGDVILTDGELAKIDAGVRDMEREGILPRSRKSDDMVAFLTQAVQGTRQAATATAPRPLTTETPKGRQMPHTFGGSVKQYDYLSDLNDQLDGQITQESLDSMQRREIGQEIDKLKALVTQRRQAARRNPSPVKQTVTDSAAEVTEDGIYRNPATGEIFKVQVAVHGSGQLYAKQAYLDGLTPEYRIPLDGTAGEDARVEWAYRPGLLAKISPEWRVTKEVAAAFGALYGRCIRCHRTLTREDSIERAMGPICSGKMGW